MRRRNCRAAKVAFVAISSEGVGPGVKTLLQRSSMKEAISAVRRVYLIGGQMYFVSSGGSALSQLNRS